MKYYLYVIFAMLIFTSCDKKDHEYGTLSFVTEKDVPAIVKIGANNKIGEITKVGMFDCNSSSFSIDLREGDYQIIINNGVDPDYDNNIIIRKDDCKTIVY